MPSLRSLQPHLMWPMIPASGRVSAHRVRFLQRIANHGKRVLFNRSAVLLPNKSLSGLRSRYSPSLRFICGHLWSTLRFNSPQCGTACRGYVTQQEETRGCTVNFQRAPALTKIFTEASCACGTISRRRSAIRGNPVMS